MPKAHLVSQKLYISNFSLKQKKKISIMNILLKDSMSSKNLDIFTNFN